MRILIVEDHKPSALALCQLLTERLGGEVTCELAHTLKDALAKCERFDADITVLDIGLPDADREQVGLSIPLFPPPVIVVTDFEDDNDHSFERFCYENKAQNYFTKKELRATIVKKEGADLCSAITKAYWRHVLPTRRANKLHEAVEVAHNGNG